MLPSLANLGCDTGTGLRPRGEQDTDQIEWDQPESKRAKKERRTPILVNGEWVHHYRHAPLNDANIRRAVDALHDPSQAAAVTAKYGPVAEWDVSEVEDFSRLFENHPNTVDLYGWDVGNATDMRFMFRDATSFNSDLSKWNVANVKDMSYTFCGATSFNSDLSKWNVANVKRMHGMFEEATSFNSDLSKWNVANVKDMTTMFRDATSFNSDLSRWKVGNVNEMGGMFERATSFTSDLSKWNVGNVEAMNDMFNGATSFTSDLSEWNFQKETFMYAMFEGATSFGPPLEQSADGGWTPQSLAEHMEVANTSHVLKTYRARRRWREVSELWRVVRPIVIAWMEETAKNVYQPDKMAKKLKEEFEKQFNMIRVRGRTQEFLTRARRLCDILLQTRLDVS